MNIIIFKTYQVINVVVKNEFVRYISTMQEIWKQTIYTIIMWLRSLCLVL